MSAGRRARAVRTDNPVRIVSLLPSATEIVCALGHNSASRGRSRTCLASGGPRVAGGARRAGGPDLCRRRVAVFRRPGPRLVDSLEILAHVLHAEGHPLPSDRPGRSASVRRMTGAHDRSGHAPVSMPFDPRGPRGEQPHREADPSHGGVARRRRCPRAAHPDDANQSDERPERRPIVRRRCAAGMRGGRARSRRRRGRPPREAFPAPNARGRDPPLVHRATTAGQVGASRNRAASG